MIRAELYRLALAPPRWLCAERKHAVRGRRSQYGICTGYLGRRDGRCKGVGAIVVRVDIYALRVLFCEGARLHLLRGGQKLDALCVCSADDVRTALEARGLTYSRARPRA